MGRFLILTCLWLCLIWGTRADEPVREGTLVAIDAEGLWTVDSGGSTVRVRPRIVDATGPRLWYQQRQRLIGRRLAFSSLGRDRSGAVAARITWLESDLK